MSFQAFDLEPTKCPFCRHALDAASGEGGRGPEEGDAIFCIQCTALLILGPGMNPRPASYAETAELFADETARRLCDALRRSKGLSRQ